MCTSCGNDYGDNTNYGSISLETQALIGSLNAELSSFPALAAIPNSISVSSVLANTGLLAILSAVAPPFCLTRCPSCDF